MNKEIIRSIYALLGRKRWKKASGQSGQALPLVLGITALGIMVVAPFLSHAGTNLISAQNYHQMLNEQYSADAGVEQAIWRLLEDDLPSQIPDVNDTITYKLSGEVNNLFPVITVTRAPSEKKDTQPVFEIESTAGSTSIITRVLLINGEIKINTWQVEK